MTGLPSQFHTEEGTNNDSEPQSFISRAQMFYQGEYGPAFTFVVTNSRSMQELAEDAEDKVFAMQLKVRVTGTTEIDGVKTSYTTDEIDGKMVYFDAVVFTLDELRGSDPGSAVVRTMEAKGITKVVRTHNGLLFPFFDETDLIVETAKAGVIIEPFQGKGSNAFLAYQGYVERKQEERRRRIAARKNR